MKKIAMIFVAVALIASGYMTTAVFAKGMQGESMATGSEEMSHWIGKEVRNMDGETLGTVKDLVRESEGKISFAIVSHGGFLGIGEKDVAVPFSALTYDENEKYFTCNFSKDRLAGAPAFKDKDELADRSFAEEVYRYYGVQPYWTGEGMSKQGMESEQKGMGMEKEKQY